MKKIKKTNHWYDLIEDITFGAENQGVNTKDRYLVILQNSDWCGCLTINKEEEMANFLLDDIKRGEESSAYSIYDRDFNELEMDVKIKVSFKK